MSKVLVVEDVQSLRDVLKAVLEGEGYEVEACADAESAILALQKTSYSCILADFKLPKKNGIDLLKETRERFARVPFIIMTAYGSIEIAVEAMKLGANDFLCKPFEPKMLCSVIKDVIQHKRIIERNFGSSTRRDRNFLSKHPSVERLLHETRKAAGVDTSILLLGESGTGKELIARYIHEQSPRKEKHFIAINCAAMPEELLESELFGHESGAFTGATQTRIGVFELASEGTIFLDEVGDMPANLQVKLLRALQEREIKRVGSNKTIRVNPRIIAATNRDIDEILNNGNLREDFYYRIAVISFFIPPLRDRPCDIELLTTYFLDYFSTQLGKSLLLDDGAIQLIKTYPWPGNARELENVIERAAILADEVITKEHLGIQLELDYEALDEASRCLPKIAEQASRKAEVDMIKRILDRTMGNKSKAAQMLGVSYKTLLNKVKEYNIS